MEAVPEVALPRVRELAPVWVILLSDPVTVTTPLTLETGPPSAAMRRLPRVRVAPDSMLRMPEVLARGLTAISRSELTAPFAPFRKVTVPEPPMAPQKG